MHICTRKLLFSSHCLFLILLFVRRRTATCKINVPNSWPSITGHVHDEGNKRDRRTVTASLYPVPKYLFDSLFLPPSRHDLPDSVSVNKFNCKGEKIDLGCILFFTSPCRKWGTILLKIDMQFKSILTQTLIFFSEETYIESEAKGNAARRRK